jgi:hypothetical protein
MFIQSHFAYQVFVHLAIGQRRTTKHTNTGAPGTEPVGDRPRVGSCRLTRLQPRQVRILTGHTTEHGNGWHPWSWALGSAWVRRGRHFPAAQP